MSNITVTKIIYSPRCLEYAEPGHPESPDRVRRVWEFLREHNASFIEAQPCGEEDLLLVHTPQLLDKIKKGLIADFDTPNHKNIFDYACLAAGGAIQAAQYALQGSGAFSLMRPPGHHAKRDKVGGFCYVNNIAVAVAKVLPVAKRVAIVDIDCHHGQGTEDIFKGQENILYVSLHRLGIYPGTGLKSKANYHNYPLSKGASEEMWLKFFSQALVEVKNFNPGLVAVSAGFDTYKQDPVGGLSLDVETYKEIGRRLAALGYPLFSVLEGGYSNALPNCVYYYLLGLNN